ncbi:hypothetical protein Tco_1255270 [Tanacetum coccineum]
MFSFDVMFKAPHAPDEVVICCCDDAVLRDLCKTVSRYRSLLDYTVEWVVLGGDVLHNIGIIRVGTWMDMTQHDDAYTGDESRDGMFFALHIEWTLLVILGNGLMIDAGRYYVSRYLAHELARVSGREGYRVALDRISEWAQNGAALFRGEMRHRVFVSCNTCHGGCARGWDAVRRVVKYMYRQFVCMVY